MYFAPELLNLLVKTIWKYQITEQYFNEFADQPRNTEFWNPFCTEEEEDAGDADDDVAHYHDGDSHRADSAFAVMKSSCEHNLQVLQNGFHAFQEIPDWHEQTK
jgi:hypothetical protein